MRKGEIACYKQFLLFSRCFPQLYIVKMRQNAALFGNGLTTLEKKHFRNVEGKGGNVGYHRSFLFTSS